MFTPNTSGLKQTSSYIYLFLDNTYVNNGEIYVVWCHHKESQILLFHRSENTGTGQRRAATWRVTRYYRLRVLLSPLVPGLFGESLAIAGRTLCPTSGCWERLKWDFFPASSVSESCGCMDMWLIFLTLICSPDSLSEGLVSGGGQWANHVPRGCSRLIGISRRWGWARHLPGGCPDGGPWSTSGKWTQQRAALARAPIPDLTWGIKHENDTRLIFLSKHLADEMGSHPYIVITCSLSTHVLAFHEDDVSWSPGLRSDRCITFFEPEFTFKFLDHNVLQILSWFWFYLHLSDITIFSTRTSVRWAYAIEQCLQVSPSVSP